MKIDMKRTMIDVFKNKAERLLGCLKVVYGPSTHTAMVGI